MKNMTFGALLRQARKNKKLTQKELAKISGLSLMSIRRYESDTTIPSIGKATLLAITLNCKQLMDPLVQTNTLIERLSPSISDNTTEINLLPYKVFIDTVIDHDTSVLPYLTTYAQILIHINQSGREHINQLIKALSKVPNYQIE